MMKLLPVPVKDEDIEEMFNFADKDANGELSYEEFQVNEHKVQYYSHILASHDINFQFSM